MGALVTTAKALAGFGDRDPGATQVDPVVLGVALVLLGTVAIAYAWSRLGASRPVSSRSATPRPRPESVGAGSGV